MEPPRMPRDGMVAVDTMRMPPFGRATAHSSVTLDEPMSRTEKWMPRGPRRLA
jgi:hypothetical protein